MASSDVGRMLSVGAICFERVGQGEVGECTTLADNAWWPLQLPVEKRSFHLVGTPFQAAFSQEERSLVGGPLLLNAH